MNNSISVNKTINDQGLIIEEIEIFKNKINLNFNDNNFKYLNNFLHYRVTNKNKIIVYLGMKKLLTIDSHKNVTINNMTSNIELSFFNHLFKHAKDTNLFKFFSTGDKSYFDISKIFNSYGKLNSDLCIINSSNWKDQVLNSDMHTHLQEILNSYEFIDFIVYVLKKYNIDENTINKYKNLDPNLFRIDVNKVGLKFNELSYALLNRNNIFSEIKDIIGLKDFKELYLMLYQYIIENKFKKEGIEYSEISFSTPATLKYINDNVEDINHHFLLSINRNSKDIFPHIEKEGKKKVKSIAKTLEEYLDKGLIVGFDIMGEETTINKDYFDELFSILVPIVMNHPSSVVRCHAGESKDDDNILNTLKQIKHARDNYIEFISEQTNKDINEISKIFDNEPRIRIGHGIHFDKSNFKEMCKLMKELNVTVEINITSNLKLGYKENLSEINEIVNLYRKNKIPFILSTDGGGMYSTSINQEENLLYSIGDESYLEYIKDSEENSKFKVKKNLGDDIRNVGNLFVKRKTKELLNMDFVPYTYSEAVKMEKREYKTDSSYKQVLSEISRVLNFMLQNDINDSYNETISELINIREINKYNPIEAKIKLFLLEKNTNIIEGFPTLKYIDNLYINNIDVCNNLENIDYELYENYVDIVQNKTYDKRR